LPKSRRQTLSRVFQILGASLVLLDVLLYFGVLGYIQSLASSEEQQFAALRRRIYDEEIRIERLKKFREALPQAEKRLDALKREHAPSRRQGYSQAHKLVQTATDQSKTQLTSVGYKLDSSTSGPLQRLELLIVVSGPFPALLKFAHALETASELIVIRSFSIAATEENALELRLGADLYLMP